MFDPRTVHDKKGSKRGITRRAKQSRGHDVGELQITGKQRAFGDVQLQLNHRDGLWLPLSERLMLSLSLSPFLSLSLSLSPCVSLSRLWIKLLSLLLFHLGTSRNREEIKPRRVWQRKRVAVGGEDRGEERHGTHAAWAHLKHDSWYPARSKRYLPISKRYKQPPIAM